MISRKYIFIIVALSLFFLAILGVAYFLKEYKQVTFTIDYPDASAAIINGSDTSSSPVATVKNSSSMWLKKQKYFARFNGDELSSDPIAIIVDDKTSTISLSPDLSSATLTNILKSEKPTIDARVIGSITASSPYTTGEERLYHRGEWYTVSLQVYQASSNDPEISNPDSVDTFYLVLKKNGSDWTVAAGPSLIITKPDNPQVPSYVIDAIDPGKTFLSGR